MEDKKTLISFITITSLLNVFLIYMLVVGLNQYITNIDSIKNGDKLIQDFKETFAAFKAKTNTERKDLTPLKKRFSSTTSISGYANDLVLKTNEKNIQINKNTILTTTDKEIFMEVTLIGTLNSITNVINEIENELPLTEITDSSIEVNGNLIKVKLSLRILINQND